MGNNLRDASGGITRRFDDKRQFAYLLLHCGCQRIVLVFLDAHLFRIGEEPSRGIVHKGIRACPVSRGCGNGGGGTIYRDSFSRVPHRKGVAARSKQMVGGMGGGSLRTRIVTHGDRPCGRYVDTLTAGRPVGCHRNLPVVGMRRVIKRVLHAGREQHGGCHSHHIYILSCLHILFLRVRITSIPMSHRH